MMVNFGFKIHKDRQIDYNQNDKKILENIVREEPSLKICISCGTCTATCSSGVFTDINLRKIIILLKHGETDNLKQEMSKCMLCGKCQLVCPRGVNTRNLIYNLQKYLHVQ